MEMNEMPQGSWIAYMGNLVKQKGGLNLAQGIPGFDPPEELVGLLHYYLKQEVHQYPPSTGDFKLLSQLAAGYEQYGDFVPENFMVVQGATEGISLFYTYLSTIVDKPKVLVFDPPYESFTNLPKIFKHELVTFPTPLEGELDPNRLEKLIASGKINIIILCSPGNPFGKALTQNETVNIFNLAIKYNCYVIYDHVYKDIFFDEEPYHPLYSCFPNLLYVNSFSKSLSVTGWRIGYILAHREHMEKIKTVHDYIGLCAPSLLQRAIAEYLDKYDFGKIYTRTIREKLSGSYRFIERSLKTLGFTMPAIH